MRVDSPQKQSKPKRENGGYKERNTITKPRAGGLFGEQLNYIRERLKYPPNGHFIWPLTQLNISKHLSLKKGKKRYTKGPKQPATHYRRQVKASTYL